MTATKGKTRMMIHGDDGVCACGAKLTGLAGIGVVVCGTKHNESATFAVTTILAATPATKKYLRVQQHDGSRWDVPVDIIARNRAAFYAEKDDEFGGDFERSLQEDTLPLFAEDDYAIKDWAGGNMDWSDVVDVATMVVPPKPLSDDDYQEAWVNGEKTVVIR